MRAMSLRELVTVLDVDEAFVLELEAEELVYRDEQGLYSLEQAERVRVCWTMRAELGVNFEGVQVALHLLDRLLEERSRNRAVLERFKDRWQQ